MKTTTTWAWSSGNTLWKDFKKTDSGKGMANDGGNGAGITLSGNSYTAIKWIDANHDGMIADEDSDDGSRSGDDRVFVDGAYKTVLESPTYVKSTMVVNGKPMTVTLDAFVFTDGTYIIRLRDEDIPKGIKPDDIDQIRLGRWDGTEYYASRTDIRDDPFMCFEAGVLIDTDRGPVAAGDLQAGNRVLTRDGGFRPLRWIGRRTVAGKGDMAPVVMTVDEARVRVSQQHRVLVTGWKAELLTGEDEVLVAAQHLVNGDTVRIEPCERVTWVHLLLDRHEVICSQGLWSESLHPDLARLDEEQRAEVLALFPELERYGPTARRCLRRWEAMAMAA